MHSTDSHPSGKTSQSTKRRPPVWTGEKRDGVPLARGILIPPSPRGVKIGETYIVAITCPYCGLRHVHGWPHGPTDIRPRMLASHCIKIDSQPYWVRLDHDCEVGCD